MLYHLLRYFNWLFLVCGFKKPFIMESGKPDKIRIYNKFWSSVLMSSYLLLYIFRPSKTFALVEKKYIIGLIGSINDVALTLLLFLINILRGDKNCIEIYNIIVGIITKFNIKHSSLRFFAIKMYFWFGIPVMCLLSFIAYEIIQNTNIKISIIRAPTTIALLHLSLHLFILIAILDFMNKKLIRNLKPKDKFRLFVPIEVITKKSIKNQLKYSFDTDIYFMVNDEDMAGNLDMKDISLIYYDICRCITLLEKQHGFQVLCDIWINFMDGVLMICFLTPESVADGKKTSIPWFLILRWLMPYICHMGLAWLSDQIRQQVETTDALLMKSAIDFRNDKLVSNILDSFSAQVRSNRLKFRACDLFYIDYATILGTIVSVVTYSIIIIQLFVEDEHI